MRFLIALAFPESWSRAKHLRLRECGRWRLKDLRHRFPREIKLRRAIMSKKEVSANLAGSVSLGGKVSVHRLGYGAMRLTGEGIWGPPKDRKSALAVLRRAVELGVNFIDTADSY